MNDSFSDQNSVAFYQPPAGVTAAAPDSSVIPSVAAVDSSQGGGQMGAGQSQPSAVPLPPLPATPSWQSTPTMTPVTAVPDQSTMNTSPNNDIASYMPPAAPVQNMAAAPQPTTPVSDGANAQLSQGTSSPEEIVKRLADRIKAYESRSSAQADPAAQSSSSSFDTTSANMAPTPVARPTVVPAPAVSSDVSAPSDQTSVSDTHETSESAGPTMAEDEGKEESLEAQNIFELLGVMNGTETEKEAFLDQLQQVIWEDFLESDVELLLTKSEAAELKSMLAEEGKSDAERQEAAVTFLEKIVPDLENIMLEKALELKKEMVFERISGLRDLHGGRPELLTKLTEAEILCKQDKWRAAAAVLNSLK